MVVIVFYFCKLGFYIKLAKIYILLKSFWAWLAIARNQAKLEQKTIEMLCPNWEIIKIIVFIKQQYATSWTVML